MGDCCTGNVSQCVNIGVLGTRLTDLHITEDSNLQLYDHQNCTTPCRRLECASLDASCSSPDEEMLSPELDLTRNESFRQTIQRSHFAYQLQNKFLFRIDRGDCCDVFNSGTSSEGSMTDMNVSSKHFHARNQTHDNFHDSETLLYRTLDENTDTKRDSIVFDNNVRTSTPVSMGATRTSNMCSDNGNAVNYCDDPLPSIGGGAKSTQPTQEGITSLTFPNVKMSWEAVVCDTSSDESLPDFQDSFQCNHFSLISHDSEVIDIQEGPKRQSLIEAFSHVINCDSKSANSLSKPPSILKTSEYQNNLSNYPPVVSERAPRNKKERHRVSFIIPAFLDTGPHCMQQASQGGSGKLPFVPTFYKQEEEEDDDIAETELSLSTVQPRDVFQKSDDCGIRSLHDNLVDPAKDIISIFDGPNGYKQYYTAFLCCAQDDLEHFGKSFHMMLEEWGFRIFLPPRDLILTGCNFDNMSRALEERCNSKIIVVISVNYEVSEECSFLTSFAKILDPDSRKRNIIPVQIDKGVEMGNVLKGLSIIHYNHDYKCRWLKRKLVDAIAA